MTCTDDDTDAALTPNHLIYRHNINENYFNSNVTIDNNDNDDVQSSFAYMKLVQQNIFNRFKNVSLN